MQKHTWNQIFEIIRKKNLKKIVSFCTFSVYSWNFYFIGEEEKTSGNTFNPQFILLLLVLEFTQTKLLKYFLLNKRKFKQAVKWSG